MQPMIRFMALPMTISVLALPPSASAEAGAEANGHLEGGYEYDSNVTVDELNSSSGTSDQAWVFDTGLEGILKPTKATNLTLNYSLSGRRYRTLDGFDQNIHLLSADFSYDFDPVTIGTSYHYSHATLGSDPFLDYRRASVYAGSLVGDDVYLRASLQDKRKEFDDSEARDSEIRGVSLDSFFFFNNARSHFLIGFDGDWEDAQADAYDSDLLRARLAWVHKFQQGGEDNRFRLGWRYEKRDYDQVSVASSNPLFDDPLTGDLSQRPDGERVDRARVVEASWRIGLNPVFSLEPSVSWGQFESEVDSADYDKLVAGVSLRAAF